MNIDEITLGQLKQIQSLALSKSANTEEGISSMIGHKVIVRTCGAGVWFGVLSQKSGNEVILNHARRMWRWWAAKSISLSGCAIHGILHDKSKICPAVGSVWLEAIEIIPCTQVASESIEGAKNVEAT